MTDRPNPDAAAAEPSADPQAPPQEAPVQGDTPPLGTTPPQAEPPAQSYAEPIPDPALADQTPPRPIAADRREAVEPVADPSAPPQVAPEPGAPPIPLEPEPSVPEPIEPDSDPPVALEPSTEQTLALPPTTREVEPPSAPSAPSPPPTGVPVPFAVPPTDVDATRFTLKLVFGIGGGLALVGVVVVAVVIAFMTFTNSVVDKMEGTAEDFVGEVAAEDWDSAYAMLCADLRRRPVEDYVGEWESWGARGAEVRPMSARDTEVVVEFADGSAIALTVQIDQSAEAIDTSVCGWRTVAA
jgi:hypothetical protein